MWVSGEPLKIERPAFRFVAGSGCAVAIVAHSYGGAVVASLAEQEDFDRVFSVSLTDSVPARVNSHRLAEVSLNFACSQQEKGQALEDYGSFPAVSVGDDRHEVKIRKGGCGSL